MVNKRVYFLTKRRLSGEVKQELPLFPWETEVKDYPEGSAAEDADPLIDGHSRVEPPNNDAPRDR
jgi:hypothetical protein